MKTLSLSALHTVSAGCGQLTAKEAYIAYLQVCTEEDRDNIFKAHQSVFNSFGTTFPDEETIRQALITAIQNTTF